MKQALHIIGKDLRRARGWLLAWFGLLAVGALLAMRDPLDTVARPGTTWLSLITICGALLGAAWILHGDRLVGSDAFWMTRPVSRRSLLAAKTAFVAAMFVVPPFLLQAAILLRFGLEPDRWGWAAIEILVPWLVILAAGAALASVTPSLAGFFVAGIVTLFVFGAATQTLGGLFESLRWQSPEARHARNLAAAVGAIFLFATVFVRQILVPNARKPLLGMAAAVLGYFVLTLVPQGNWIRALQPKSTTKVSLELDTRRPTGVFEARRSGRREISLASHFQTGPGLEERSVEVVGFLGTLDCGSATAQLASFGQVVPVLSPSQYESGAAWAISRTPVAESPRLAGRTSVALERFFETPCSIRGEADVRVWRTQLLGRLPLKPTARLDVDSHATRIDSVEEADGVLYVTIKRRYLTLGPAGWRPPIVALVNAARREWISGMRTKQDSWKAQVLVPGPHVAAAEETWAFPIERGDSRLGGEWISGVELAVLARVPNGRLRVPVHTPDIRLKDATLGHNSFLTMAP